jgi:hypothetical protein
MEVALCAKIKGIASVCELFDEFVTDETVYIK